MNESGKEERLPLNVIALSVRNDRFRGLSKKHSAEPEHKRTDQSFT